MKLVLLVNLSRWWSGGWRIFCVCGSFHLKQFLKKKRVRAFWVPSSSVRWVCFVENPPPKKHPIIEKKFETRRIFFFFEKNWNPRLLSHSGVVVMFFPRREISGSKTQPQQKKKQQEQEENILPIFLEFPRLWTPRIFFFLVTNENFYLSLSVCVCVSWKRKNFLAVFVVFRRHLLEELAVKYVWTQNWIILDATIFGLDKTCRESICESLTFAHSKKKYLPTNEIETFQEPEVGQKKDKIWNHLEKFWKKNEFARENEKCPRAPEKKWEKFQIIRRWARLISNLI